MARKATYPPLYSSEEEIAEIVLGPAKLKEWRALAVVLERDGLPKIDPLFDRRYFPAIKAFFDRRNGVGDVSPPQAPDGKENWTNYGKKRPRKT